MGENSRKHLTSALCQKLFGKTLKEQEPRSGANDYCRLIMWAQSGVSITMTGSFVGFIGDRYR